MKKQKLLSLILVLLVVLIAILSYFVFIYRGNFFGKITFVCPVRKELCKTGKIIQVNNKYFAIGYKLDVGEAINAVIDGEGVIGKTSLKLDSGIGNYYSVFQTADSGYSIQYVFTRTQLPYGKKNYQAGEAITTADLNLIGSLNVNFLVIVYKDNKVLELKPSSFH